MRGTDGDDAGYLVYLVLAALIAACVLALWGCVGVTPTDRAHGMPLDACTVVEYDRPVWLGECEHAYKVFDRQTGDAWWLLDMGQTQYGRYVVLPLGEEDR